MTRYQHRASMRLRHKAAENADPEETPMPFKSASMRPRHKAAENIRSRARHSPHRPRFNEAAA